MRIHIACAFLLLSTVTTHSTARASVAPPIDIDDEPQCTGLSIAFERLTAVTAGTADEDINMAAPNPQAMFGTHTYGVQSIVPVTDAKTSECTLQRHRLYEKVNDIRVLGAEAIVTVNDCTAPSEEDQMAFGGGVPVPLAGVQMGSIAMFEGTTFTEISEENGGFEATKTEEEAKVALAFKYQTPIESVGHLSQIIFPSQEEGDFLCYRSEVWVSSDGDVQLYDVFISAHDLRIIQSCRKTNRQRISRRNLRQQEQEHRGLDICNSCASQATVTWTGEEVDCPINSLYLNDDGRTATCLKGTVNGREVLGPGTVAGLHYGGTYDCNSSEEICNANELPTGCSDAISDVHYGMLKSLEFNQKYLGIMGGMKVSGSNPQVFSSFVHFGNRYCNAFFTTQTNSLYFGDCDCNTWGPLTSIDVAAHELAHGVTTFSSQLIYSHQPGGLNEGYSDIMGATMEYYINDSIDTPDFNLGENLVGSGMQGNILRFMENPPQDGSSIDNVCDFTSSVNVHYSSGVLNKAFTSSVRACQASGCSTERDCVLLMGPLFMYANVHKLSALSGYLDSASQTCGVVEEFFSTRSPNTSCTTDQAKDFVATGWDVAGVAINDSCTATAKGCTIPGTPADAGNVDLSCFARLRLGVQTVFAWMARPFRGD